MTDHTEAECTLVHNAELERLRECEATIRWLHENRAEVRCDGTLWKACSRWHGCGYGATIQEAVGDCAPQQSSNA
jgi:hypothetical protein